MLAFYTSLCRVHTLSATTDLGCEIVFGGTVILGLVCLDIWFHFFPLSSRFFLYHVRNALFPTGFFNEVPVVIHVFSFFDFILFVISFVIFISFHFHLFVIYLLYISIIYNNNIYYNNSEVNFQSICKLISISSKS